MNHPRTRANFKAYARAIVALLLIVTWTTVFATGWLLWLAPRGPRSGKAPLLLELTKHQWGEVHFWIAMAATAVTVLHVAIDFKALKGCLRYLVSTHRTRECLPG